THPLPMSLPTPLAVFSMPPHPPRSTLFPYTTLFRSRRRNPGSGAGRQTSPVCTVDGSAYAHRRRGAARLTRHRFLGPQRPKESRSEEHTSELQSLTNLVCRLLLEQKK